MGFHSICIIYSPVPETTGPQQYRTQTDSYLVALLYSTHAICFWGHLGPTITPTFQLAGKRKENDAYQVTHISSTYIPLAKTKSYGHIYPQRGEGI